MKRSYKTSMVCPSQINFEISKDNVVTNIEFIGGCNGNLKAIAKLVDGWRAEEIVEKLEGNTCGRRPTSCGDQLAQALKKSISVK